MKYLFFIGTPYIDSYTGLKPHTYATLYALIIKMSSSRVRHCSQCGQAGHNRRSQLCPVNIEAAQQVHAVPPTPVATQEADAPEVYAAILNNVNRISDYISRWENRELGTPQFISLSTPTVTWVCFYMTQALSQGINCDRIIERFRDEVITINRIVHRYARADFYISLHISPESIVPEIIHRDRTRLANINAGRQQAHNLPARVNDRLNAISVVTSTVLACDCPICLESVADTSAIYTNCCHGFCVTCIKDLATSIKNNGRNKTPACPMCRQEITQLKGSLDVCDEVKNHLTSI